MGLKFRGDVLQVEVEGKVFSSKATDEEILSALKSVQDKATEMQSKMVTAEDLKESINLVVNFVEQLFGEGVYDEMINGFPNTISIAYQLFEYLSDEISKYFKGSLRNISVDRLVK